MPCILSCRIMAETAHVLMAAPREGDAACLSGRGWCMCSSAARPACDAHWVVLTTKILTMTLPVLRGVCQMHLTCVQGCCAGVCSVSVCNSTRGLVLRCTPVCDL